MLNGFHLSAQSNSCFLRVALTKCFPSICSDEGLTLETSAFQSLYGGQFTLSTPLINQIFVFSLVLVAVLYDWLKTSRHVLNRK